MSFMCAQLFSPFNLLFRNYLYIRFHLLNNLIVASLTQISNSIQIIIVVNDILNCVNLCSSQAISSTHTKIKFINIYIIYYFKFHLFTSLLNCDFIDYSALPGRNVSILLDNFLYVSLLISIDTTFCVRISLVAASK